MRYTEFDFEALCAGILELCPGTGSISDCEKLEGGFNRVFIFTLDNSERIMYSLKPVSRSPPSNSIGSEYMIMEHAEGVQLHKKWPEMTDDERVRCIDQIYRKVKEMVDFELPAFGSINFEGRLQPGFPKQPIGGGFCIGPLCGSRYWDCNASEPKYYYNTRPNQGPWTVLDQYCDGLVDAGVCRIPPKDFAAEKRASYYGSVQTHFELLKYRRSVLREISADSRIQAAATPTLFHPELHKRNIFLSETDPSKITGIIDWQSVSIEPAFWYADEVPDFTVPDDSENDLCAKAFDACSRFFTPKLAGPRLMDENLFRPFLYSYRTWKELGFAGSGPHILLPSPDELVKHELEYKLFVAAQELKHDVSNLLDTAADGWVPLNKWEATRLAHAEYFMAC